MESSKKIKISKSKQIFTEVRNQILLGKVAPGALIGEVALADEFGASRTPVRQALQKLQEIGLVEIRDGAGSFVTSASVKDMEDAYQIRCALEKVAVETAINQAVSEAIDYMRPQMTELDQTSKDKLIAGGMQLVEYDQSFFDEVLAQDGVKALYSKIDESCNGLGITLTSELAAAASKDK